MENNNITKRWVYLIEGLSANDEAGLLPSRDGQEAFCEEYDSRIINDGDRRAFDGIGGKLYAEPVFATIITDDYGQEFVISYDDHDDEETEGESDEE